MEQTLENFAFRILLFCIAAPQDPREWPSEDGVAWNSLTRVDTCRQGTVELSDGEPCTRITPA